MKSQRRFAPTGGEFTPESGARFIGIRRTCTPYLLILSQMLYVSEL